MALKLIKDDGSPVTMAEVNSELQNVLDIRGNDDKTPQIVKGCVVVENDDGKPVEYGNPNQLLTMNALVATRQRYEKEVEISSGEDVIKETSYSSADLSVSVPDDNDIDIVVDTGISVSSFPLGDICVSFEDNGKIYSFTYIIDFDEIEYLMSDAETYDIQKRNIVDGNGIGDLSTPYSYYIPLFWHTYHQYVKGVDYGDCKGGHSSIGRLRYVTFDKSGETYKLIFKIDRPCCTTVSKTATGGKYQYKMYHSAFRMPINVKYSLF